jgi:glycosyltransferase involved in cell wall biosynthesis
VRILYLHSTGAFGGSSRSLSEVCKLLSSSYDLSVITPPGSASVFFARAGMRVHLARVSQFAVTRFGYYRGLRWLLLMREILYFPITLYRLKRFLDSNAVDLVHLNEVTLLLWAVYLKRRGLPVVMHVRSVYKQFENSIRDRVFAMILRDYVDQVIAIDETVKRSLPAGVSAEVIHNSLRFPSGGPKLVTPSAHLSATLNVCIVANFIRVKGHYEFIGAAKLLLEKNLNIKFHIVGASIRKKHFFSWLLKFLGFYDDVESDIRRFVKENNMEGSVVFHGLVENIDQFYSQMNLLCFPSYYDAPGRPVFEAGFFGVPSLVAVRSPTPDTVVHLETGLVIEKPSVELIAAGIEKLYFDRSLLIELGLGARGLAMKYYTLEKNVGNLMRVYMRVTQNR